MASVVYRALFGFALALLVTAPVVAQESAPPPVSPSLPDPVAAEADWRTHVHSHTSGMVSSESEVRIRFLRDVVPASRVGQAETGLLQASPPIPGSLRFANPRELVLTPEQPLPSGTKYTVRLNGAKLAGLPPQSYSFGFQVIPQAFDLVIEGLQLPPDSSPSFTLRGTLTLADRESPERVTRVVSAKYRGKPVEIAWMHGGDGRHHDFEIRDLPRQRKATELLLEWNGGPIGVQNRGSRSIEVPARDAFQTTGIRAVQSPGQTVVVYFSDALDASQDLSGLVSLGEGTVRTRIDGNTLTLYPSRPLKGSVRVTVDGALRSARQARLQNAVDEMLEFEDPKPQVRFAGNGVILPGTKTVSIPFEAINVHSVQVTAFRIYEDNIGQFLQSNKLDGAEELGRVGRHLWRKTIALTEPTPNRWNRFAIDATDLLREAPGGLYRLSLSIHRGNSLYQCTDAEAAVPVPPAAPLKDHEDLNRVEASSWDYAEQYFGIQDGSSWADRKNPCRDAYYRYDSGASAARNFMASNIGLLAKRAPGGDLRIVATDLRTAKPLPGVELEVRNFQDRPIAKGRSNEAGFARLQPDGTPFYLIARNASEVGYLKLSKGAALPISHFEVGGEAAPDGVKGFIYGERGVWRPGDDIHLTFVLHDKDGALPENHPATLQLFSPKGQLMQSVTNAEPLGRFYTFTLRTPDDAPTGNWNARVQLGGSTYSKTLKIETVKPNRLKVELDFGTDALRKSDMPMPAALFGEWLHGATASRLKADVAAVLTPAVTRFGRYGDYVFDDPARQFRGNRITVFEGNLDDAGWARFDARLIPGSEAPGMLQAHFTSRVFEAGGDASTGRSSLPYHPYERYVGIKLPEGDAARNMLLTDTEHSVEIATVDTNGEPLNVEQVQVTLYKVHWKWWWDQSAESLAQYASASHSSRLAQEVISTVDGRGTWRFEVKYPSWGRYLVRACDLAGRHCAGRLVYIDWPGWAGRAREQNDVGASMLTLAADKDAYDVGQTAVVQLPEASRGRALLSIETGNRILDQRWVELSPGKTRLEIPLTAAMSPTAYASVTLLQPVEGKDNDRPIRLYGVIPLTVNDPGTRLRPVLKAADEWKPESTVSVEVAEAKGRAMTYTLAVVDEGLLGLTNFETPDPHGHFYAKEALGIATWDLFDDVVGAYGGTLERLLALGGDASAEQSEQGQRKKRFPPVVRFLGPYRLEAGKSHSHDVELPRYLGAVRVMVVAGEGGAYGTAEKSVYVRDALSLLATVPRVLGPGETLRVPVTVFAMDPDVREATVRVEPDGNFSPAGPAQVKVSFDEPGEKLGFFDLTVGDSVGTGSLRFVASSGKHRAESVIHVPIRHANPRTVEQTRAAIARDAAMKVSITPHGLAGSNRVALEVSAVPPLNLRNRLGYLIRYPHGCVEQVTSAVFPQLYLPTLTGLDEKRKAEVEHNVNAGIERLRGYQNGEGGFTYWPGVAGANDWASSYVGHFLVEAERLGYYVPPEMYSAWIGYQQGRARGWTDGRDSGQLHQAYRLYTLALAGKPEVGAMNRLRESFNLVPVARWQLAAAYHLAGMPDAAAELVRGRAFAPGRYEVAGNTFGSELRDRAIELDARRLLGHKEAGAAAAGVSETLNSDAWLSTHAIAYALYGLSRYVLGADGKAFDFAYTVGEGKPVRVSSSTPIHTVVLGDFPDAGAPVSIENVSGKLLYAAVVVDGVPPAGSEKASAAGISADVAYTDPEGGKVDIARVPQGTDLVARIEVANRSPYDLENIALTMIVPSGWEIHNPRFDAGPGTAQSFDYQDIRDDRLHTYFGLKRGESKTLTVLLNATYLGRFYLPGVTVEAMYEGAVRAQGRGQWVEVVAPEK